MKRVFLALAFIALPLAAASPYHLTFEANPAAPFPFLRRFGTITLHVYPGGVRAETMLLNGFSRNGARTITVENPYTRMYTNEPIAGIAPTLRMLGSIDVAASVVPSRGRSSAAKSATSTHAAIASSTDPPPGSTSGRRRRSRRTRSFAPSSTSSCAASLPAPRRRSARSPARRSTSS